MKNNHPQLKKIVNALLSVLLAVLTVIAGLALYGKVTGKQVLPYSVLWVLTPSMEVPGAETNIPMNSYILVRKIDASDVELKDVITFRSQDPVLKGSLNTHRVIGINDDHTLFTTKGDANTIADEYPVRAEDVVARYVRNLPVLTFFGRVYSTKTGFLTSVGIILIGIAFWFHSYVKKTGEEEKQAEMDRLVAEEVARLEAEAASKKDPAKAEPETTTPPQDTPAGNHNDKE